ncbi:MAG: glycosyltransferase family 39 protein [Kouleothrix sp.]|nr:glycosyltransferase family 39 protein [Kouleothrix sp.]
MTVTRYVLGLMLALALLLGLRLPFLRCEPFIPGTPLLFDEKDYIRGAKAMPVGDTSVDTNEAWIRAPGTSWALLTVARLRGVPVELAGCDFQRAQVGLWAVMLLLVAAIAGMLFGRGAALATALLFAITPIPAAVTLMLHADTLFCAAQVAAVWALLVYARRPHLAWPVAAGVLAGLAALVRSPILPLLPLLALWVTLDSWRRLRPPVAPPERAKPRWRAVRALGRELRAARALTLRQALRVLLPGILLLACAAAVLAPWTIRNYRLYGGFIPSDTTGAVNLLDNNAPKGYSTFNRIRAASDNPAERQRFATSQALAFIRADLPGFARKVAYASWLAWSPDSFRRTWDFWTALTERPLVGALFAQFTVLLWPTIALAMLGLLFAPHAAAGARGYRAVMLVVVLYYTLTIGVTHFEERYRMPFLLLWMPYAGWCLAHPRALIVRLRRPAGAIAVVVAVALAISYAPQIWPLQWENARALALHARGLLRAQSGDIAGGLGDQRAAAELQPDLLEAYVVAGDLLAQQDDQAGAEQALRAALAGAQAVKLRPPADATVALQRLLRAQGRLDDSANLDSDLSLPARRRAEALAWRRGGAPGPSLRLGADDLGLVRGFYSVDRQHAFRWSAPQAQLLLAGQGDYVCLSVNAGRPPDVPAPLVTLAARTSGQAQVEIGQLHPPRNGWAWLCARLPAPADGEVEITLSATAYNPLAHGALSDPRDLGVNLQEAALRSGPLAIDGASGLLLDQPATAEPAQALQLIGISGAARGRPGEQVPLTIWWRDAQPPPAGAFTFLHVLDAGGQTVASYNAPLAGDRRPQPWVADEPLLDYATIPLPATLAPGRYRLIGGAFDPASGAQLAKAELGELLVEGK